MSGHAVRRAMVVAGAALLVACGSEGDGNGGSYQAPQPAVAASVRGVGDASGLELTGRFEAYIESDRELRLRIQNTSPETSSAVEDGPLLTAVGFNLAGALPAECLEVTGAEDGAALLALSERDEVFCRRQVERGAVEDRFHVVLTSGAWTVGVARVEQRDVRIRIADGCASDYAFTREVLLDAPHSRAGGASAQWIASFTRVGIDGADVGCALGESTPAPPKAPLTETWTDFIATAAEAEPSESERQPDDTRAGSLEARFVDDIDREGAPLAPALPIVIASLRNGAGEILEEWHLNDVWPPATVGADGCDSTAPHRYCFLYADPGEGEAAAVDLPQSVRDSNARFDEEGDRVSIRGTFGFTEGSAPEGDAPVRRFLRLRWERPIDIGRARLKLRARADANRDGTFDDDPFVTLFRARWEGSGADFVAPPLTVIEETQTSVTVEIDVDAANLYVFKEYGAQP